jgi:hypothetical protein
MKYIFPVSVPTLGDHGCKGLLARLTLVHEFASECEHQDNSQMKRLVLSNHGLRGAYKRGKLARYQGLPREAPYKGIYVSRANMVRAWLAGYDSKCQPSTA